MTNIHQVSIVGYTFSVGNEASEPLMDVRNSTMVVSQSHFIGENRLSTGPIFKASFSRVTLRKTTIKELTATQGLIYVVQKSNLFLDQVSIVGNGDFPYPSAISVASHTTVQVANSSFIFNKAAKGSCFFIREKCKLSDSGSLFESNAAGIDGGVIYMEPKSSLHLESSNVSKNTPFVSGVLVPCTISCDHNVSVRIQNSKFENNSFVDDTSRKPEDGTQKAAVFCVRNHASLLIRKSAFMHNRADLVVQRKGHIFIDDCAFQHNGPDLITIEANGVIAIQNTSFSENIGGISCTNNCKVSVHSSIVHRNIQHFNASFLFVGVNSVVNLLDSWFQGQQGQVLDLGQNTTADIANCTFVRNQGRIILARHQVAIKKGIFVLNNVRSGSLIQCDGKQSRLDISDSVFGQNTLDSSLLFSTTIFVQFSNLSGNIGNILILFYGFESQLGIFHSLIHNNSVIGGLIPCRKNQTQLTIADSWFDHNDVPFKPEVYLLPCATNIVLQSSNFTENNGSFLNTCEHSSGRWISVNTDHCTFSGNSKSIIFTICERTRFDVNNTKFVDNTWEPNGVVLLFFEGRSNVTFTNSLFVRNTASRFDALINVAFATIAVRNCTFTDNTYTVLSGYQADMTIEQCTFSNFVQTVDAIDLNSNLLLATFHSYILTQHTKFLGDAKLNINVSDHSEGYFSDNYIAVGIRVFLKSTANFSGFLEFAYLKEEKDQWSLDYELPKLFVFSRSSVLFSNATVRISFTRTVVFLSSNVHSLLRISNTTMVNNATFAHLSTVRSVVNFLVFGKETTIVVTSSKLSSTSLCGIRSLKSQITVHNTEMSNMILDLSNSNGTFKNCCFINTLLENGETPNPPGNFLHINNMLCNERKRTNYLIFGQNLLLKYLVVENSILVLGYVLEEEDINFFEPWQIETLLLYNTTLVLPSELALNESWNVRATVNQSRMLTWNSTISNGHIATDSEDTDFLSKVNDTGIFHHCPQQVGARNCGHFRGNTNSTDAPKMALLPEHINTPFASGKSLALLELFEASHIRHFVCVDLVLFFFVLLRVLHLTHKLKLVWHLDEKLCMSYISEKYRIASHDV